MEKSMRRKPIQVVSDSAGAVSESEYQKYKLQTRGEYEDLMMEFEFRCRRAAMMHYYEASRYDNKVYHMELLSAFIGCISATSIGMWLLQRQQEVSFSHLGTVGALGLGATFLMQVLGKGSTRILPSFTRRQNLHITAAAAWQKLSMKTRSYRIQLDNPKLDVDTYAEWYSDLINTREGLCAQVTVPQSTYKLYCDPKRVFRPLKQRRLMFLKFLELEDMDEGDISESSEL